MVLIVSNFFGQSWYDRVIYNKSIPGDDEEPLAMDRKLIKQKLFPLILAKEK